MYLLTEPWSTFWVFTSSSLLVAASNPLKSVPRVETGSVSACKQLNHNMKSTRNTTKKCHSKVNEKDISIHSFLLYIEVLSEAGLLPLGMVVLVWALFRPLSWLSDCDPELKLLVVGIAHVLRWHIEEIHQGYTRVLTIERWCWSFPLLMPGVSVGHGQAARLSSIDLVPYFNICMEPRAWWIHSIMDSWVWTCHERKYNAKRST